MLDNLEAAAENDEITPELAERLSTDVVGIDVEMSVGVS